MSPVVPSATLAAPLPTKPPAIAQLDDASTTDPLQNDAAKGNDSAAVKSSDTLPSQSATDSSSTTTPTPPATNPPPGGAAPEKSSTTSPALPTNSDKGTTNAETKDVATSLIQNTQENSTPSNTANSNSNAATPPVGGSASDTSATPVAPQSSATTPSGTTSTNAADSVTTAPPTTSTLPGSSTSGADTQAPTNVRNSSPNSSSLPSTNSGTSFFQNKGLVIGLAVAGGLLIALFLIYVITRSTRSRRRRQLDREMDASFEETVNRWRPTPTVADQDLGADLRRAPSAMSNVSASYMEPPMAVASQQPNYGFAQGGYGYAPQEYWTAGPPPPQMGMAMGAAPAMGTGMSMGPGPQMMQQSHRGEVHATQTHTQWESGLVRQPSESAAVQLAPQLQTQVPTQNYLSNYTSPPPQGLARADSPVSSTPMPNPFDSKDERVLKVANE